MTEIEELFIKADNITTYPSSMKKIIGGIKDVAFFPGGSGLINLTDQTISNKPIMIVGQDFDTLKNYEFLAEHGRKDVNENKTWNNLRELLKAVKIPEENCFFTNAILGARVENKSTGKSPAFKHSPFIQDCQAFFLHQIAIQKPEIILVLGIQTARFLSDLSIDLVSWMTIKSIKEIDKNEKQFVIATFKNGLKCKLVLLTHPSFRKLNVKNRKYKGLEGDKAEFELITTALQ